MAEEEVKKESGWSVAGTTPYRGPSRLRALLFTHGSVVIDLTATNVTVYRHLTREEAETFCRDLAELLGVAMVEAAQPQNGGVE